MKKIASKALTALRSGRVLMALSNQPALRTASDKLAGLMGGIALNDEASRPSSPILIIGCGRSGNTLLRSMLMAGGEISIPPESYVWPRIIRMHMFWRFQGWNRYCENVINAFESHVEFYTWDCTFDAARRDALELPKSRRSLAGLLDILYRDYARQMGMEGRRWGDKTPLNTLFLPLIDQVYPRAQYIHIIRDPRAVAMSYVKAAQGNSLIRENTFEKAANRWTESVRAAKALSLDIGPERFHEVRYEDLVTRPQEALGAICTFLGTDYSPDMLRFHEHAKDLGDVAKHAHHESVSKPLDPSRLDKWREMITPQARVEVDSIVGSLARPYGYTS